MKATAKKENKKETKKEYRTWKKSVEKDGVTKSVCVKEVENGYVVDINEYSYGLMDSYDNSKTFIAKENPLEGEEEYKEEKEDSKKMMEAIEALDL